MTADAVTHAHQADLKTQGKYDVEILRYWFDEGTGKVFCLINAPSKEAAIAVHREAHGLVADETDRGHRGQVRIDRWQGAVTDCSLLTSWEGERIMVTIMERAAEPASVAPARFADELDAIKARQRATWGSGDFGIIGTTLQIVGESLCEAVEVRAGAKVLDVAAGNGNCSLAAARRWCDVTSTDYVPALLEDGRRRAAAERLSIRFREADAEALPFADGTFDVVLSSFGVMFRAQSAAGGP